MVEEERLADASPLVRFGDSRLVGDCMGVESWSANWEHCLSHMFCSAGERSTGEVSDGESDSHAVCGLGGRPLEPCSVAVAWSICSAERERRGRTRVGPCSGIRGSEVELVCGEVIWMACDLSLRSTWRVIASD